MSIVVYQKKKNRMILIVKDFLLPTPLSTIFLLCQILIDIQSKKKNKPTHNSSRTRESVWIP